MITQALTSGQITQQQHDDLQLLNRLGSLPAATLPDEVLTGLMALPTMRAEYGPLIDRDPKGVLEDWKLTLRRRIADSQAALGTPTPAVPAAASSQAAYCIACGAKMPETAAFCPGCGTKRVSL